MIVVTKTVCEKHWIGYKGERHPIITIQIIAFCKTKEKAREIISQKKLETDSDENVYVKFDVNEVEICENCLNN